MIFFGVAKLSNIFLGCLKFLIFFFFLGGGGVVDAGPKPTYEEKISPPPRPPPPPGLDPLESSKRDLTHMRFSALPTSHGAHWLIW